MKLFNNIRARFVPYVEPVTLSGEATLPFFTFASLLNKEQL